MQIFIYILLLQESDGVDEPRRAEADGYETVISVFNQTNIHSLSHHTYTINVESPISQTPVTACSSFLCGTCVFTLFKSSYPWSIIQYWRNANIKRRVNKTPCSFYILNLLTTDLNSLQTEPASSYVPTVDSVSLWSPLLAPQPSEPPLRPCHTRLLPDVQKPRDRPAHSHQPAPAPAPLPSSSSHWTTPAKWAGSRPTSTELDLGRSIHVNQTTSRAHWQLHAT